MKVRTISVLPLPAGYNLLSLHATALRISRSVSRAAISCTTEDRASPRVLQEREVLLAKRRVDLELLEQHYRPIVAEVDQTNVTVAERDGHCERGTEDVLLHVLRRLLPQGWVRGGGEDGGERLSDEGEIPVEAQCQID